MLRVMQRLSLVLTMLTMLVIAAPAASIIGNPVLGTWTANTTCSAQYNALMKYPGLRRYANEMVVGNGFVPGVQRVGELKDPAHPCRGSVARKHSHFFTKSRSFGSLDWNGEEVDDGSYTLVGTNRITIHKEFPSVTFIYAITGKSIKFTPLIPRTCSSFRCAWAISMAIPGTAWTRR